MAPNLRGSSVPRDTDLGMSRIEAGRGAGTGVTSEPRVTPKEEDEAPEKNGAVNVTGPPDPEGSAWPLCPVWSRPGAREQHGRHGVTQATRGRAPPRHP